MGSPTTASAHAATTMHPPCQKGQHRRAKQLRYRHSDVTQPQKRAHAGISTSPTGGDSGYTTPCSPSPTKMMHKRGSGAASPPRPRPPAPKARRALFADTHTNSIPAAAAGALSTLKQIAPTPPPPVGVTGVTALPAVITAAGSSDVDFRLPLPAADPVRRRPSSIFSTADDRFSEMMVTLAGRRGSGGSAVSSEAGAGTAADALELDDNGDIRWVIRTNTVQINRLPGQTLGMVVYSEKGKYGSRIDRVKPDGVAEAAGLRAEDIFVRLGDEVVIHCDHKQLVQKLLALPLCFTADVTESSQLPRAKGRYSIEMWSEAQRRGLENAALATFKASAQASVLETVQESPTRLRSSPTLWLTALSDDENEAAIADSCCSDDDDNLTLG